MEPENILQRLIQFNTTNPPGNEAECIEFIAKLLKEVDIESKFYYKDPKRLNLFTRIKGDNKSPPLMFYGHVDVVTTLNQNWRYPPFIGKIVDGSVWGRGALDMKGGLAIILSAIIKARLNKIRFPGDVICCFVSDEEDTGEFGAKYLVENHSNLFKEIRYAIGEFGGFSLRVANKIFYPIQIAEKQVCRIEVVFNGTPGHGSAYITDQAINKLALFIRNIKYSKFPVHINPITKLMISEMANKLNFPLNIIFRLLLNPLFTNFILKLLGTAGDNFQPMFRNILNGTILNGGDKLNVIPSQISLKLDGRLLPGISSSQFLHEIKKIAGNELELKIIEYKEFDKKIDMGLFDKLKSVLKEIDPNGYAIPFLLPGSTDARFFSQIGIQTYGFIPMPVPEDISFFKMIHGANERIPISALRSGTDAIYKLLQIF